MILIFTYFAKIFIFLLLLVSVLAPQPSAIPPYEAPLRDLPWAKLNFLHTTDVHGWLGGHLQEPSFSADWGDYISFASHLRDRADSEGSDILLIDTGDRIEGNGLFDASDPKGKYYYDIYKHQHIDVLCTGNHELYKANSSNAEFYHTVPNYKNSYIASNLDIIDPERNTWEPLAPRFRKFETKNQKLRVLAFGFIFDFTGNANNTIVQPVEKTIKEEWFRKALEDKEVDVIVVIGHVGVRMNEFSIIHRAIRDAQWDVPIVYFGGHVHVRDYTSYDKNSAALASGRYLETIGFLSVDGIKPPGNKDKHEVASSAAASFKFQRRYIDNNLFSLKHHSGTNDTTFDTDAGIEVSKTITKARKHLQLNKAIGCAPSTLYVNRAPYPDASSIFSWIADTVFPQQLARAPQITAALALNPAYKALALTNTGAIRFDIFKGPFTRDTQYLVSPFTSGFRFIPDVPASLAARILELLNGKGPIFHDSVALAAQGSPQPVAAAAAATDTPWSALPALHTWRLIPPEQRGEIMRAHANPAGAAGGSAGVGAAQKPQRYIAKPSANTGTFSNSNSDSDNDRAHGAATPPLQPGYTTRDDLGTDGDDTEHAAVQFFLVPNAIQAGIGFDARDATWWVPRGGEDEAEEEEEEKEEEKKKKKKMKEEKEEERVDLVFNEFVQPWVVTGLQYLGMAVTVNDTRVFWEGKTVTDVLTDWVEENWPCEKEVDEEQRLKTIPKLEF